MCYLGCGCKKLVAKFCGYCRKITPLGKLPAIGKINIAGESKVFVFAIAFESYVDDTLLGTFKNGITLSYDVSLCLHEIVFKSTDKGVTQGVVLNEQKEVILEIVPKIS